MWEWVKNMFDIQGEAQENARFKERAKTDRALAIIVYDVYDKISRRYSTQTNVHWIQFYLDMTRDTPRYLYDIVDYRERKVVENVPASVSV